MTDTGDTVSYLEKIMIYASLKYRHFQQVDAAKTSKHDWANLPQLAIEKITEHLLQIEQFNGPKNIQANLSVNYHWHEAVKDTVARQPNSNEKMKITAMDQSARISFLTYLKESDGLEKLKHLEIEDTSDCSILHSLGPHPEVLTVLYSVQPVLIISTTNDTSEFFNIQSECSMCDMYCTLHLLEIEGFQLESLYLSSNDSNPGSYSNAYYKIMMRDKLSTFFQDHCRVLKHLIIR